MCDLDDPDVRFRDLSSPLYAFAPGEFGVEWPEEFLDGDYRYRKVGGGTLNETDHECHCHGTLATWAGRPGEPSEPLPEEKVAEWRKEGKANGAPVGRPVYWECGDSFLGHPYPECTRCEGDGTVVSDGGDWALYEEDP